MNDVTTPPPERDLPAGRQLRRRAELVALLDAERDHRPATSRRRVWVSLAAATSVTALLVGGTVAVDSLAPTNDAPSTTAGAGESNPRPASTPSASPTAAPAQRPPAVTELGSSERRARLDQCLNSVDRNLPAPARDYRPVLGVRLKRPVADAPRTWLIAKAGNDRIACIEKKTSGSEPPKTTITAFGGAASKDTSYLYAPVDQRADGFGMVTSNVESVTVQSRHGKEQAAVVRNGYWFAPMPAASQPRDEEPAVTPTSPPNDSTDSNEQIGVAPGYTLRGYDEDGSLVYNSRKQGPLPGRCYTKPDGTTVIVAGTQGPDPDPSECERLFPWRR